MNKTTQTLILSIACGGLLAAALVSLVPEQTLEDVGQAPVKQLSSKVQAPAPRAHHSNADHHHHHHDETETHAHVDFSKGFDPSTLSAAPKAPSVNPDDRDEAIIRLVNATTRQEKRRAIAFLSKEEMRNQEIHETFDRLLQRESDEKIQALLVNALARDQHPRWAATMESLALDTRSPFLHSRIVLALSKFPEAISFPSLLNLAENAHSDLRPQAIKRLAKQFPAEPETEILLAELR